MENFDIMKSDQNNLQAKFFIPLLTELQDRKNSMPKIIKKTTVKKVVSKKVSPTTKIKKTEIKKPVIKKVLKKTKVIKSIKTNKVAIDVISDEPDFFDNLEIKDDMPTFSNWPVLKQEKEIEDTETKTDFDNKDEIVVDEEYDKQKKFFADWASQIAPQKGEEKPRVAPRGKSLGLYRKMAFKFIIATVVLLVFVCYFFFPKLNIIVTPQSEAINDTLSFLVSEQGSSTSTSSIASEGTEKKIAGVIKEVTVIAEKNYQTSGEEIVGEETISGQVYIINKYNKAQPLIAKTRLLSPDGKLFRIQESVNVPAGGQVLVFIYADKPSAEMALAANTRFTIPGLWAGLQDKIYAENNAAFSYDSQTKYAVQQKDLDLAKKDIAEVLNLKAKNEIDTNNRTDITIYGDVSELPTYVINTKVGEEKSSFTVSASKKIVVLNFSKDIVAKMAQARLSLLIPDDKQLSDFDGSQITYNLEEYDANTKSALVKAYFGASMFLKSDSSLLDKKKLVGLNNKQISKYLDSFPEIKTYELKFSPSFITNAPNLPDKINITVNNTN